MYTFKEIYFTLQGEGVHTGQPAIFCRFTGCNLWTGREKDRHKAICQFCDTDFIGTDGPNGGKYDGASFVEVIKRIWPDDNGPIWVVFTGGEPLLQLDEALIDLCHQNDIKIAVESNGTILAPQGIDWLCISPKAGSEIIQQSGHELKLVFPQLGAEPIIFESWDFEYFSLQPMDDPHRTDKFGEAQINQTNLLAALEYCKAHPQWRLSVQLHKALGLP